MHADLPLCPPAVTDTAIRWVVHRTTTEMLQVANLTGESECHGQNAPFFLLHRSVPHSRSAGNAREPAPMGDHGRPSPFPTGKIRPLPVVRPPNRLDTPGDRSPSDTGRSPPNVIKALSVVMVVQCVTLSELEHEATRKRADAADSLRHWQRQCRGHTRFCAQFQFS